MSNENKPSDASEEITAEKLHVETDEKAGRPGGFFSRLFGNSGAFDFNSKNDHVGHGSELYTYDDGSQILVDCKGNIS